MTNIHESYPVGTIVALGKYCLNNEAGSLGVVYEQYEIGHPGISIIFENGNYDGFSETDLTLCEINKRGFAASVADYSFTNVMQLSDDFSSGVFDGVF